ncbi:hypothetical protein METP2_00225 [Methanosarcinales archaeon]|nr:hypothetical protein METP2_00225 [Methanosarcinales archaeon]
MVKLIILIIVIGIAIVFSGCTESKDVTSAFKAIPDVQQFLSEHPTAKITMTYWSKEEVEKSSTEISQQCDKIITPVAMYKATVSEGDLKLISWINADTQIVMCSLTQSNNDLVKQPTPTILQTPKRTPYVKAPSVQLRITATTTDLKLTHNGGDLLILKDQRITITNAVNNAAIDGITGMALSNTTFQNADTPVETLGAGSSITHTWDAPPKGGILNIMIQDIPSGQIITQMKVTVVQAKAPSVQLRFTAAGKLTITHNGGDLLILKDLRITITDAVTNAEVDGITGMALNNITFQNADTPVETLSAGSLITHAWTVGSEPAKGTVLKIMLQDIPSDKVITQIQVFVT